MLRTRMSQICAIALLLLVACHGFSIDKSGHPTVTSDPTDPLHLTNKRYVDATTSGSQVSATLSINVVEVYEFHMAFNVSHMPKEAGYVIELMPAEKGGTSAIVHISTVVGDIAYLEFPETACSYTAVACKLEGGRICGYPVPIESPSPHRGYKTDSGNGGYLEYLREEMPAEYTVFGTFKTGNGIMRLIASHLNINRVEYLIQLNPSTKLFDFFYGGSQYSKTITGLDTTIGKWVNMAVTVTASGTAKGYINGYAFDICTDRIVMRITNQNIVTGAYYYPSTNSIRTTTTDRLCPGAIMGEVVVYNRVLTPTEATDITQRSLPSSKTRAALESEVAFKINPDTSMLRNSVEVTERCAAPNYLAVVD